MHCRAGFLLLAALYLSPITTGSLLKTQTTAHSSQGGAVSAKDLLRIEQGSRTTVIKVYRDNGKAAILTENACFDTRPYIHPVVAPDGKGLPAKRSLSQGFGKCR